MTSNSPRPPPHQNYQNYPILLVDIITDQFGMLWGERGGRVSGWGSGNTTNRPHSKLSASSSGGVEMLFRDIQISDNKKRRHKHLHIESAERRQNGGRMRAKNWNGMHTTRQRPYRSPNAKANATRSGFRCIHITISTEKASTVYSSDSLLYYI